MRNNSLPTSGCGRLSIIVPVLNEIELLPELAAHLHIWKKRGCEVILVDGGSHDGTTDVADVMGFQTVRVERGRARQMNAGAAQANGEVLVFLHADTRLPDNANEMILNSVNKLARCWGRFNVQIEGSGIVLYFVAQLMNLRSQVTGIATGDQAIFIKRNVFEQLGGFPEQPLMEDVELSKRLIKAVGRPVCLASKVKTSGRRWIKYGLWRTIILMWRLRWSYWRGVSPVLLAERYP